MAQSPNLSNGWSSAIELMSNLTIEATNFEKCKKSTASCKVAKIHRDDLVPIPLLPFRYWADRYSKCATFQYYRPQGWRTCYKNRRRHRSYPWLPKIRRRTPVESLPLPLRNETVTKNVQNDAAKQIQTCTNLWIRWKRKNDVYSRLFQVCLMCYASGLKSGRPACDPRHCAA